LDAVASVKAIVTKRLASQSQRQLWSVDQEAFRRKLKAVAAHRVLLGLAQLFINARGLTQEQHKGAIIPAVLHIPGNPLSASIGEQICHKYLPTAASGAAMSHQRGLLL
jgi:hypothetical protein